LTKIDHDRPRAAGKQFLEEPKLELQTQAMEAARRAVENQSEAESKLGRAVENQFQEEINF
jgi:hypothetical protein